MKRIFSFLFAIITLVGTTGVFTSCQEDAPEINYTINITVNNDFTEVVNALNNGTMKQEAAIAALTAAINQMNGDQAEKLQGLIEAINNMATTVEAKLAIIEAAMKAQTLALEAKLDLLTAAIKALPDYTDQLKALEAAIKGMPDYSDKLAAIETAIKNIPDYSDKLAALETALKAIADNIEAQEGQYADELAALTESIDAIKSEVAAGNKSQEEALAEIIALLESGALAGGGSDEGEEDEVTIPYVTFTADAAQTLSYGGSDLQYSTDGTTFQDLPANTPIDFGGNTKLYLRGVNNLDGNYFEFLDFTFGYQISFGNDDVPVACTGDIRTLIDYKTYNTVDTRNATFRSLFKNCTQLTSAPELPATDLAVGCYISMFSGCTSLETAPELPATTLVVDCYMNMFNGCEKLNKITMLATEGYDQFKGSFFGWVSGVAATGTFIKAASMDDLPSGSEHGIPTGWTVVNQ